MIKISKIFGDFVPREFSVGQGLLQTSRHFENRRGEGPGDEVELNLWQSLAGLVFDQNCRPGYIRTPLEGHIFQS